MEASEWAPLLGDMPYAERVKLMRSVESSVERERTATIGLAVDFIKEALTDYGCEIGEVLLALFEAMPESEQRTKVADILSVIFKLEETEEEVT